MRKVHLLTTVAAGLLLATAAGAADNSDQKSKSEMSNPAPAAQQAAPAEKVAPSMKAGERKAPETTGQATKSDDKTKSELKASDGGKAGMKTEEKKPETTGQTPKASDSKSEMKSESMDKAGAAKPDASKSSATVKDTERSGAAQKSTESTTGQGAAAGSAKLSAEQRSKITTVIKKQNVKPVQLNVSVSVGTRIPASVHFYPLPQEVVVIYPEWRGYDYILVGDQIVVVDPRSHEIVAILEA